MTIMRKSIVTALAALSLGAAAVGAQAQTAAPATQDQAHPQAQHQGRFGHGQKLTPEQRAAFRAKRIAKLHDELKITPAQEQAWNTFVASMQPPARGQHGPRADRAALAKLPAPERMAKAIERQKQRTAAMEQRLGALNDFYAVLTPEQKQTFDAKAARMQHRFHRGAGGWQGNGQGRGSDTARG
ncbi:Spy/CpxP family protein refolding chaperone [Massilia sp. YIM B02763]|uniref:Spy/CpxP family protein refolding chaperone n=1 Tax=Massilia sp. YIM B02763 TaxID=3050130 RepID=UPI0025B6F632|nr:Spy/CpxP family protein refolding chaperone [Massilia sp. YIM B02763]MDN4055782.1 Spy/CpxP family protein refolding chaperone [Massilia sp. YIM B02763]